MDKIEDITLYEVGELLERLRAEQARDDEEFLYKLYCGEYADQASEAPE